MPTLRELLLDFDPVQGLRLPPQWLQGRTAYGGITTATALAAAHALTADGLPPLRSAQVSFIGPASGQLRYQVQPLRMGKSVSHVAVDVSGEDGLPRRSSGRRSSSWMWAPWCRPSWPISSCVRLPVRCR